jgi:hypothetical protein
MIRWHPAPPRHHGTAHPENRAKPALTTAIPLLRAPSSLAQASFKVPPKLQQPKHAPAAERSRTKSNHLNDPGCSLGLRQPLTCNGWHPADLERDQTRRQSKREEERKKTAGRKFWFSRGGERNSGFHRGALLSDTDPACACELVGQIVTTLAFPENEEKEASTAREMTKKQTGRITSAPFQSDSVRLYLLPTFPRNLGLNHGERADAGGFPGRHQDGARPGARW